MASSRWPEASMLLACSSCASRAIALGRRLGQIGEGLRRGLGIGDALGGGEGDRRLVALGRFVALPQLETGNADNDHRRQGDEVIAIGLPEFFQFFAANVFFDFAEDVTQRKFLSAGLGPGLFREAFEGTR